MSRTYKVNLKHALRHAIRSLRALSDDMETVRVSRGEVFNFTVNFRAGRKRDAIGASRSRVVQATVAALIASGIYTVDNIIIDLNRHLPKHIRYEQEIIDALIQSGIESPELHISYILKHSQFYATAIGH